MSPTISTPILAADLTDRPQRRLPRWLVWHHLAGVSDLVQETIAGHEVELRLAGVALIVRSVKRPGGATPIRLASSTAPWPMPTRAAYEPTPAAEIHGAAPSAGAMVTRRISTVPHIPA